MKGKNEDGGSLCSSRRVDSFCVGTSSVLACRLQHRLGWSQLLLLGHRHIDYPMPIAMIYLMRDHTPNRPPTSCSCSAISEAMPDQLSWQFCAHIFGFNLFDFFGNKNKQTWISLAHFRVSTPATLVIRSAGLLPQRKYARVLKDRPIGMGIFSTKPI